jgi:hypothetical protein
VRWINIWSDYRAARAEQVPLTRWVPWMLSTQAKYGFALTDPLPIPRAVAGRFRTRFRSRS